jgi:hypothetical protein
LAVDPYTYDQAPHGRDRNFLHPTGIINRIVFASMKMNRQMHCEGDNERDAVALLEVHPDVLEYREQPQLGLHVEISGKVRQVFPDFELRYRDGRSEIVDVVRTRQLAKEDKKARMRLIGRRCRDLGYPYRIWTDVDIGRQPRLSAANAICWRGRQNLSDKVIACATSRLFECKTVGALMEVLGVPTGVVCALVLQGHVSIDITDGLSDRSPILGAGWRQEELQ